MDACKWEHTRSVSSPDFCSSCRRSLSWGSGDGTDAMMDFGSWSRWRFRWLRRRSGARLPFLTTPHARARLQSLSPAPFGWHLNWDSSAVRRWPSTIWDLANCPRLSERRSRFTTCFHTTVSSGSSDSREQNARQAADADPQRIEYSTELRRSV